MTKCVDNIQILDFKLSLSSDCSMLSAGLFPAVCSLNANVSARCVCSIFMGGLVWSVTVVGSVGYYTGCST
jgi:hypothetical protein